MISNNYRKKTLGSLIESKKNKYKYSEMTPIQQRLYNLNSVKVGDLSLDDLRFLINQEIGLEYLVLESLEYLKKDLFTEASYYQGDLLSTILHLPSEFWKKNEEIRTLFDQIIINYLKSDDYSELQKRYKSQSNIFDLENVMEIIKVALQFLKDYTKIKTKNTENTDMKSINEDI